MLEGRSYRQRLLGGAAVGTLVGLAAVLFACGEDPPSDGSRATDSAEAGAPLCVDGKPTSAWPPGPYAKTIDETLPPGLAFDGPDGRVELASFYEPCAERSRVLVLRSSAAWCGTCGWHAKYTTRFLEDPRLAGRLALVDLLVADEDNMPATPTAAMRWKTRIGSAQKIAIDPAFTFAEALLAPAPLPLYVFVDTKTMRVLSSLANPPPEALKDMVALEIALLDGAPRPTRDAPKRFDELFTEDQWDMIHEMTQPGAAPPDPTNEYADVPAAAALGGRFFGEVKMTPSGLKACSTCHRPDEDLNDHVPQSIGLGGVGLNRNSPIIALSGHARWQFWDGRADTLWAQALGPPEEPLEMGSSRLFVAHRIVDLYQAEYDAVFGAKYPLPVAQIQALPPEGKPGDAAYDALATADKAAVTRVYVNFGKAIAAYERTFRSGTNAFDRYVAGDLTALTKAQKDGLQMFFTVGCAQCHWGPRLTDDAFHALRFPTGRQDKLVDRGRIDVLATLATREFVATSPWSDAPSAAKLLTLPIAEKMLGAFKTPTLRDLTKSGPYGHGGTFATLAEVAHHYGMRGKDQSDATAAGVVEAWQPAFDEHGQEMLPAFLETLTGEIVVPR